MTEQHFYVENARLMSYGLSNLGTRKTKISMAGDEPIDALAGKLIGSGFHTDRALSTDQLIEYTQHTNPFIRRSAYIGLSFTGFFQNSDRVNEALASGFYDPELEVRKTALIGFGLANMGNPNQSIGKVLDTHLHDEAWKIRSASGLAYSFLSCGKPEQFSRFIDLLKIEHSPYVKVCNCWYISNAFAGTRGGLDEYKKLLNLEGDENSFFRDMACLGLGLSYLGTSEQTINELLEDRIKNDIHPYVRESAFFGLALCNYQNPTNEMTKMLSEGLKDDSMIVRSGAALSHGIVAMETEDLELDLKDYSDSSVLWGLTLSEGLANVKPSQVTFTDNYVQWGHHISNGFRNQISTNLDCDHEDVKSFQQGINDGLIGSHVADEQEKNAVRLIVPGVYHYLNYDSFWWGLWVLTALGTTLHNRRINNG
ncbi:MAG: hypothetical protein Q7R97_05245 [Candidatus Daviesbacteria bacterium]|nr:hypothetical protein [Candidatus Daviesbacteria bacterium]